MEILKTGDCWLCPQCFEMKQEAEGERISLCLSCGYMVKVVVVKVNIPPFNLVDINNIVKIRPYTGGQ